MTFDVSDVVSVADVFNVAGESPQYCALKKKGNKATDACLWLMLFCFAVVATFTSEAAVFCLFVFADRSV